MASGRLPPASVAECVFVTRVYMQSFDDNHDESLVARSQAGDRAALEMLTRRYLRALYTVAVRMLGDPRAAREATQTALVHTHRLLLERHRDNGFFHMAHRLLVEGCLELLASQPDGSRAAVDQTLEEAVQEAVREATHFRELTFDERRQRLQEAILQLPPDMRAVVAMRHVAGLSYNETAITLNLSRQRVRARLHTARQLLGERLMAWSSRAGLSADEEALLQDAIDGELDFDDREARERLLGEHPDAHARASALRDLGHLLNSLGPSEPPATLAPAVLRQIAG